MARAIELSSTLLAPMAWLLVSACGGDAREPLEPRAIAEAQAASVAAAAAIAPPPKAPPSAVPPAAVSRPRAVKGAEIAIAAGTLRLGSPTGSADRNPAREADDVAVEVPAFAIDALPFPNDPELAPKNGVSRSEAAALCAEQGKRLCSEFEWERACKGDENLAYPSMDGFEAARCGSSSTACVSPFGVFGLGTTAREWTLSPATSGLGDALRRAVVRGAAKDASDPRQHRCAARDAATPDSRSDSLTFRCCRGPEPKLSYPSEPERPVFEELSASEAEVRAELAKMPETRDVAASFRFFTADERTKALQKAGHSRAGMAPWLAVERPLAWSPVRGERIVAVVGDTPKGAVLVVYYPLADGRLLFAGSLAAKDEHTAMLLAYKPDVPTEVLFSTCWGCGGEGGAIVLGPDARVQLVQR